MAGKVKYSKIHLKNCYSIDFSVPCGTKFQNIFKAYCGLFREKPEARDEAIGGFKPTCVAEQFKI